MGGCAFKKGQCGSKSCREMAFIFTITLALMACNSFYVSMHLAPGGPHHLLGVRLLSSSLRSASVSSRVLKYKTNLLVVVNDISAFSFSSLYICIITIQSIIFYSIIHFQKFDVLLKWHFCCLHLFCSF